MKEAACGSREVEERRPPGVAAGFSCGWDYLQLVRILEDQKLFFHILRVIQKLPESPAIKSEFYH